MEKKTAILLLLFLVIVIPILELNAQNKPQINTQSTNPAKPLSWTYLKQQGSKLIFKEGSFDTKLYDLKYIGQVSVDNQAPFLVFSGRDCNECDANISIYFHSPRNGNLNVAAGKNRYSYPGKEFDYLDNALIYESRAFYGEIQKGIKGIIWFQKTKGDDNKFKQSVFILRILGNNPKGEESNDYKIKLEQTLQLNKAGKNTEIKGLEFTSEP